NVHVLPKPVQQPHPPIWVGASRSDDTFRWAGEQGFHLMTLPYMYEPSVLQHWVGIYREALVEAGHDPAAREILGKFHIYVTESNDAVLQVGLRLTEHRVVDPRQVPHLRDREQRRGAP